MIDNMSLIQDEVRTTFLDVTAEKCTKHAQRTALCYHITSCAISGYCSMPFYRCWPSSSKYAVTQPRPREPAVGVGRRGECYHRPIQYTLIQLTYARFYRMSVHVKSVSSNGFFIGCHWQQKTRIPNSSFHGGMNFEKLMCWKTFEKTTGYSHPAVTRPISM